MAINLGDAVIKVKTDMAMAKKGLKSLTQSMKKFALPVVAAVGLATAAVVKMVTSYANAGDQIDKMSKRTGMGAESLSELKHAAELSGASLEAVEKGAKRMAKTIEDAKDGLSTAVRAFDKLGISVTDFEGLSPDQAFDKLTMAIAAVEDPMKRAAIAQDVFGRAGTQLLPMMAEGAEGLAAMREEAHRLGLVFTEEAAASAAEFNDNLLRAKMAVKGVFFSIAKELLPVINDWLKRLHALVPEIRKWIEANLDIEETFRKITRALKILIPLLSTAGLLMILPKLIVGINALATALIWLNANPIVALITIISIGLYTAISTIIRRWEDFKWAIQETGRVITEFVEVAGERIRTFFDGMKAAIHEFIFGTWASFRQALQAAWRGSWFTDAMENMQQAAEVSFDSIIERVMRTIAAMANLKRSMRAGTAHEWTSRILGSMGRGLEETRRELVRMFKAGTLQRGTLEAALAQARETLRERRGAGADIHVLNAINRLIVFLQGTLVMMRTSPQGDVTINVNVPEGQNAEVIAQSLYQMIKSDLGASGTQLGFV